MRAVRPFLFWGFARTLATPGGSLRSGNPTPTARANLALSNDRELAPRRRAKVRELSPYSSQQSRWRGGAAFWVGVRVSQRLYNHHSRDEGLVR